MGCEFVEGDLLRLVVGAVARGDGANAVGHADGRDEERLADRAFGLPQQGPLPLPK